MPKGPVGPAVGQVQGGNKIFIQVISASHALFLAWQDTERFQARSQKLEHRLLSKERELEQLIQKQKRVSFHQCPQMPGPRCVLFGFTHFPCLALRTSFYPLI